MSGKKPSFALSRASPELSIPEFIFAKPSSKSVAAVGGKKAPLLQLDFEIKPLQTENKSPPKLHTDVEAPLKLLTAEYDNPVRPFESPRPANPHTRGTTPAKAETPRPASRREVDPLDSLKRAYNAIVRDRQQHDSLLERISVQDQELSQLRRDKQKLQLQLEKHHAHISAQDKTILSLKEDYMDFAQEISSIARGVSLIADTKDILVREVLAIRKTLSDAMAIGQRLREDVESSKQSSESVLQNMSAFTAAQEDWHRNAFTREDHNIPLREELNRLAEDYKAELKKSTGQEQWTAQLMQQQSQLQTTLASMSERSMTAKTGREMALLLQTIADNSSKSQAQILTLTANLEALPRTSIQRDAETQVIDEHPETEQPAGILKRTRPSPNYSQDLPHVHVPIHDIPSKSRKSSKGPASKAKSGSATAKGESRYPSRNPGKSDELRPSKRPRFSEESMSDGQLGSGELV